MRSIRTVERELAEAESIAAGGHPDVYDNKGALVATGEQRRAQYATRIATLRVELETLRRIVAEDLTRK